MASTGASSDIQLVIMQQVLIVQPGQIAIDYRYMRSTQRTTAASVLQFNRAKILNDFVGMQGTRAQQHCSAAVPVALQ